MDATIILENLVICSKVMVAHVTDCAVIICVPRNERIGSSVPVSGVKGVDKPRCARLSATSPGYEHNVPRCSRIVFLEKFVSGQRIYRLISSGEPRLRYNEPEPEKYDQETYRKRLSHLSGDGIPVPVR